MAFRSTAFAPIIGYTGKVQEDQIDNLNENWRASQNAASSEAADGVEKYDLNDIVGRIGIEKSMELEPGQLHGIDDIDHIESRLIRKL